MHLRICTQRGTCTQRDNRADWNMARPLSSPPTGNRTLQELTSLRWKLATLPTFNSMSAEAVIGLDVPGLSETFFYSNDDMFFNARE